MNKKDLAKIELEFLTSDLVENNVYPASFLQEHTVLPEELGRGAFSIVIVAMHKASKEKRAVKVVENPTLSDVLDLQREVKILKQLEHKNILKVFSTYTKPGIFLMVSEVCKGKELFKKIVEMYDVEQDDVEVYGFTERHASSIVRQLASALQYCHQKGIIHRDIKAENVLVGEPDVDGNFANVKLIDFGLAAKLKEGRSTYVDTPCGTPGYVPPEILQNSSTGEVTFTRKSDMWSLGVLTYELVCGYSPFYAQNKKESLERCRKGDYSFHEHSWSEVSDTCKNCISKMLIISPRSRASMDQILETPWLTKDIVELEHYDLDVEDNLRHTLARKRWKKGMRLVLAINRMRHKVRVLMDLQRATKREAELKAANEKIKKASTIQ